VPRIPPHLERYAQPVGLMPRDVQEMLDRNAAKANAIANAREVVP
jgi:hypothetical protein